jgi:hypothetical protein
VRRRAPCRQVAFEGRRGLVAERHQAGLAALAVDEELSLGGADVVAAQIDQLLAAQTAAVEQLEDEPVAQRQRIGADDGVADGVDLGRPQGVRQAPAAARAGQVLRRIGRQHAPFGQKAAERAHGRELASQGSGGIAAPAKLRSEGAHRAAVERGEIDPALAAPVGELGQVGGIRAPRGL